MHIFTIKSRREFVEIQNTCIKSFKTNNLILLYKKVNELELEKSKIKEFSKFGICVTKKIDKRAVIRNRIKRLLRESFKKIIKKNNEILINNYKYEFIAKKNILNTNFSQIYQDMFFLINQLQNKISCDY